MQGERCASFAGHGSDWNGESSDFWKEAGTAVAPSSERSSAQQEDLGERGGQRQEDEEGRKQGGKAPPSRGRGAGVADSGKKMKKYEVVAVSASTRSESQ